MLKTFPWWRWLKLIEAPLQDLLPLSKMLLQTFHPKPKNKTSPPQLHLHPLPVTMQVRLKRRLHKQVLVSNHIGPDYPLPPMVTLWTFVDCNCIVYYKCCLDHLILPCNRSRTVEVILERIPLAFGNLSVPVSTDGPVQILSDGGSSPSSRYEVVLAILLVQHRTSSA